MDTWNSSITLNAEWNDNKVIILEATATEVNQTLKINKYFSNSYTVDWWDGSPVETVSADKTHTYTWDWTYTITLSLTGSATRWKFKSYYYPLVPKAGTTMTWVKIVFMPSLADGFGNGAAIPWDYFFYNFNSKWAITSLPEWSFVTSNVTTAGVVFFSNFNSNWLLTSLPEWSFDTSNITTVTSNYFFSSFNSDWLLTSLPEWSFDISNITYIGGDYFFSSFNYNWSLIGLPEWSFKFSTWLTTGSNYFFSSFNSNWLLTSLPTWSFNTENITIVRGDFFSKFNSGWLLTSLPTWSFITNNITIAGNSFFEGFNNNWLLTSLPTWSFKFSTWLTTAGINFFRNFNSKWGLVSLPDWSFNTENIASVGISFFQDFNNSWSLTSLPEWSFKFSTWLTNSKGGFFQAFNSKWALIGLPAWSFNMENITIAGNNFFYNFNDYWQLTSLPTWSFITSNITTGGDYFFSSFNSNWKITSLPEWSFDTSNITTVGNYFFSSFNNNWQLTSLPDWSFNLSKITTGGDHFFSSFNSYWKITSLPEWSFDTSNITTVWNYFFYYFNNNWQLTELPDSFKLTSAAYNKSYGYQNAFNSSNYTFNKKVLDLVKWITVPSNDRNTFSDNQPWRCGVHPNWLQTTANACSISYDDGLWGTWEFKYTADTTWVVVWSGITLPTVEGYIFGGWYTASWNRVDEVSFPELDGQTLYARWVDNVEPTIEFTWATPTDGAIQAQSYFTGQVDITEENLSGFKWTMDGNQSSLYDDSLILMYNFDKVESLWETATLVKDMSKYGRDATVNGATWSSAGERWWAYSFDGSDDYIVTNSPEVSSTFGTWKHITVSTWVKATSWVDRSFVIWQASWGNYSQSSFGLWQNKNWYTCALWTFTAWNAATAYKKTADYKPSPADTWHHVMCILDGNDLKLYVDGVQRWSTVSVSWVVGRRVWTNGIYVWRNTWNKTFPGQIDEVRVYNRVLSATEIAELYRWNLSKVDTDKWTYTTKYTWLAEWTHIYTWEAEDIAGQTVSTSRTLNIDYPPVVTMLAKNVNTGMSRLTWTCMDTGWINAYYFWTNSNPSDFIDIATTTGFTTWMEITSAGTYYLFCRDINGSVGTWSTTYQSYTLTFNANGWTVSQSTKSVIYGNTYDDLPTPIRTWYEFKGWYGSFSNGKTYVKYGRSYMYTDVISIHLSAYLADWSQFATQRIISCTENGWWNLQPSGWKFQFPGYDYVSSNNKAYKTAVSATPLTGLASGWHDFDMIFDGNYGYLYIDGVLEWTSPVYTSHKITYHGSNSILVWAEAGANNAPASTPAYFKWNIGNLVIQHSSGLIDTTGAYNTITAPAQNMTLYARWEPIEYNITYNLNGWEESLPNPVSYTIASWTFWLYQPTKTGYMFLWWTWSNGNTPNGNVYITQWSIWNRTYNAVWWSFNDIDAFFISDTWAISYITLMDRNLWASTSDISSTDSYWFHYQWWNNYGFANTWYILSWNTQAIWDSSYENNWYNGYTFIKWNHDYWILSGYYDWLRWWSWDNESNYYWLDNVTSTNIVNRQWPCPDWRHVPSEWEWNNLFVYWYNSVKSWNLSTSSLQKITRTNLAKDFSEIFSIPFAGDRNFGSARLSDVGSYIHLWSSSPSNNHNSYGSYSNAHHLSSLNVNSVWLWANNRSMGESLRCFSDDYLFTQPSMTIHPNGWTGAMIIVEWDTIKSLWIPNRDAHSIFEWWYSTSEFTTWSEVNTWSTAPANLYARWSCDSIGFKDNGTGCVLNKDIILEATTTSAGKTITINKYFSNAYIVDWWDGSPVETVSADKTHTYTWDWTYTITLSLTGSATRWIFQNVTKPLVPKNGTTATNVKITYMPSLADWFGDNATNPGYYFFERFNENWAIESLPDGSFDTSNIETVWEAAFTYFNKGWKLESLPEWSFDISKITTVWVAFFAYFNFDWKLTSLPDDSFKFSTWLTTAWDYFFSYFNQSGWALTSLPEWSFDISHITQVGVDFFCSFNYIWMMESLPEWSFRLSTWLTTVWNNFFAAFNYSWMIESLPEWSFDTSNIETVWNSFFHSFNRAWALRSLPDWSFNLSKITTAGNSFFRLFNDGWALERVWEDSFKFSTWTTTVWDYFFYAFNQNWKNLTWLSSWSFDISHIVSTWDYFFAMFNKAWAIESLPEWSFRLSSWLTTIWNNFFYSFNNNWALESLPEWSFDTSNIASVWNSFFNRFNYDWAIENLPDWSFNLSKITTVWNDFFTAFNYSWALETVWEDSFKLSTWLTTVGNNFFYAFNQIWKSLTWLSDGSFDISYIISAGDNFFWQFNRAWAIESLPEWSFDASNIEIVWKNAFRNFNKNWKIIDLPDSFIMNSVISEANTGYQSSFNSPDYTINRKVSDLVSWVTAPLEDMDTFSDNQPWRCGVHENWLETTADACSISYDDGKWWTGEFKYTADTTWVEVWSGITLPTVEGYIFGGWYTASWDRVDEVSFPELDGQTLYARWVDNVDPIVSADKDWVWWNEDFDITLTAVDDNLDYAKYSRVSSWDCVSSGTSFASGDTITYATEWTGTLYLCASDVAGNIGTWSGTYYLDKTRPVITFDQQSWAAANSHSVEITATDTWSKLELESNVSWITTNADWSKTVLWNDINLTVASWDLYWRYVWWCSVPYSDDEWNYIEWIDYDDLNCWYGYDNSRWWENDVYENWFNSWLNPERQWPCATWRHVPSAWEYNSLAIAWCNLDDECNPSINIDEYWNFYGDGLWDRFWRVFDVSDDGFYRSSSPSSSSYWSYFSAWWDYLFMSAEERGADARVRCFKDVTEESSALKYRWQTGSTCSSDKNDYTSKFRDAYDETNTTVTTTVSTQWLSDGSYYLCVLSWSISDNAWNVNVTEKTSGQFIVDNTDPIVSADKAWAWWNEDIDITLTVIDDNLNYAKYSWTSTGDCVSNGTSFSNWDTITYSTEWSGKLYLCASDVAGNIGTWSGIYYLDKTRPSITFDQQSGAAAHSHSVEITASDILSKLAVDVSCWSWLWTPPEETYASWVVYWCDGDIPIITIYWDNGKWITIKAMNEWATAISYANEDTNSYWSLYQWWNNYGFPSSADTTTPIASSTTPVSAEWYAPGTYSNETWITRGDFRDSSDNRNLWWWSWDEKNKNWWWWYDTTRFSVVNASDRQAMCPDGYHIPSMWEWNMLLYLWWNNSWMPAERYWGDLYRIVQTSAWTKFSEDMQIPFVGYRYNYDYGSHSGVYGYYWTSSPNDWNRARHFHIVTNALYGNESSEYRGYGYAVRCFKNSYVDFVPPSSEAISPALKYRWQTGSTCSSNESDYTAMSRDSYSEANLTATATVTTSWLDDGNYYLCVLSWSISDNAWNVNVTTKTQWTFIVDNTAPIVSADKDWVWWNEDFDITLTAIDDNLDYAKYSRTSASDCVTNGTSFSNWDTITYSTEWTGTLYLCVADRVWSTATWSGVYYLDKTDPVCGTWTYEPSLTAWTSGTVTATLSWSTDVTAWIQTWGWSCTISVYNATCDVTISDKAWRTTVCTSSGATNIDLELPTASIATTSTLKTWTQTATLSCSDNAGVTSYYRWNDDTPSDGDYVNIESAIDFSTWKAVTAAWTYYLFCKDAAGNVNAGVSQTYYSYTVYNMEENANGTKSNYNTNNYTQKSVNTYIAPNGTTLVLDDIYTNPTSGCDTFMWVSMRAPNTNTAGITGTNPTLTGNSSYGMWFARNTYGLTLLVWTGISKVTWSWTYKWWKNVAIDATVKNGYTWGTWTKTTWTDLSTFTPATKSQTVVMACGATTLRADTTVNVYTITYNLNWWIESVANPTTYTVERWTFWLYQPRKAGAIFLWWTWSNGDVVHGGVTIPAWSTWNKTYNAVWWDFEDLDAYFISSTGNVSHYTMMDRNMWASEAYNGNTSSPNTWSYGFHYQRWNNYGFESCYTEGCDTFPWWETTTSNLVSQSDRFEKTLSRYESNVFVMLNISSGSTSWMKNTTEEAGNMWWWKWDTHTWNWTWTVSDRQWPCPDGYYVPSNFDFRSIIAAWRGGGNPSASSNMYNFSSDFLLPLAWYRAGKSLWVIMEYWTGIYWTSSPEPATKNLAAYEIGLLWSRGAINLNYRWHIEAYSVRCFKGTENIKIEHIYPNWWTGATIIVQWNNMKSLWTPKRANSKFEWWYSNAELTTSVTTWSTAPADLYAKWSCDTGYVQNIAGDGCTKLYTITYNLNWWTETIANPTSYTVESWAITLQTPIKTWYTFLWWTGTNWDVAENPITIPAWSTGNRTYNAVWSANTNTQYMVYHYVKRVWQSTYENIETETKYGTSDAILILSSLAKSGGFVCATYDRWSLSWTESWPWEIVTETTINSDGSTKIYLYYNRNNRTVRLSGDAHVDYLEINWVIDDEAERECGSEVPVNAIPKPWYHFVRWDREVRTEEEWEWWNWWGWWEGNPHSGWSTR